MRFFFSRKHLLLSAMIFIAAALQAQTSRPVVSEINAAPLSSNKIEIRWKLPPQQSTDEGQIRAIYIYRDIRPISSISSKKSIAVLPSYASSYTDTPGDFREYFYAVVTELTSDGSAGASNGGLYFDEEIDTPPQETRGKIYNVILPGVNATVRGARISGKTESIEELNEKQYLLQTKEAEEKVYGENRLREQPLPYMDILGDMNTLHERKISVEAEEKAKLLLKGKKTESKKILSEYVFPEDLIEGTDDDEIALFEILKDSFIKKDYVEAEKSLDKFLPKVKNQDVKNRTIFYLGECAYFNGNMPNAINHFILLQDTYPSLCRRWIKSSLDLYVIVGN